MEELARAASPRLVAAPGDDSVNPRRARLVACRTDYVAGMTILPVEVRAGRQAEDARPIRFAAAGASRGAP